MHQHCRNALILLALGLMPDVAFGASPKAAVVSLLAVNVSVETLDELSERVADALAKASGAVVQGGREVRRRLPDDAVAPNCPALPACIASMRRRLESESLVFVVVTRVGNEIQIDPTLVARGTAVAEARPAVRGELVLFRNADWLRGQVSDWLPASRLPANATVAQPSDDPSRLPHWSFWAAAGVSVAAAAAGVGFGISAGRDADALEDRGCATMPCAPSDIDAVDDQARIADALYITAGVSATAALILFFVLDDESPSLSVAASPRQVGIAGRF